MFPFFSVMCSCCSGDWWTAGRGRPACYAHVVSLSPECRKCFDFFPAEISVWWLISVGGLYSSMNTLIDERWTDIHRSYLPLSVRVKTLLQVSVRIKQRWCLLKTDHSNHYCRNTSSWIITHRAVSPSNYISDEGDRKHQIQIIKSLRQV